MMDLGVAPTRQRYPMLYGMTLAYIVGLPNFIHFDVTGRTSNALNFTSISSIIESVIIGYLLVALLLLERRPLIVRKIRIHTWMWILLLADFLIATALQPVSLLTAPKATDGILSLFRLGQWTVAFCLIVALYSRTPREQANELVVRLIGRASWIWLAMIWFILPIMPRQVYGGSEDSTAVRRLGGQLIHPAHVALLASMAFFYALMFFRPGPRKWLLCAIPLVSLVLTGARGQQAGFLLVLLLFTIIYTRKPAIRWGTVALLGLVLLLGVAFSNKVMKYVARGQSVQTLSSLDDRTRVWQASIEAIKKRPLIGYGYSVGARNAIRDHWRFAHWIPPHAHNDYLQAALDGGVLAFVIITFVYWRVLLLSFLRVKRGPYQLFLLIVFIQFVLNSFTGSEFGHDYGGTDGLLLLCCLSVLGDDSSSPLNTAGERLTSNPEAEPSLEMSVA
jgi:O-Antigen ligase